MSVSTKIHILGKEYDIKGDDSEEYIHRVALHVNNTMMQLKTSNQQIDSNMLHVLTSMTLADEYMKTKDELEKTRRELEKYKRSAYSNQLRR